MSIVKKTFGDDTPLFRIAERYDQIADWMYRQPWYRDEHLFQAIDNELPVQFSSALELCCGGGKLLKHLAKRYPSCRFDAVDISEKMVDLATENNCKNTNVNIVTGDWIDPIKDNKYDVIIVKNALHLLDNLEERLILLHDISHVTTCLIVVETISPNKTTNRFVKRLFDAIDPCKMKRHFFVDKALREILDITGWRSSNSRVFKQYINVDDWLNAKAYDADCRRKAERIFTNVIRNLRRPKGPKRSRIVDGMEMKFDGGNLPKRMLRLQKIHKCVRNEIAVARMKKELSSSSPMKSASRDMITNNNAV